MHLASHQTANYESVCVGRAVGWTPLAPTCWAWDRWVITELGFPARLAAQGILDSMGDTEEADIKVLLDGRRSDEEFRLPRCIGSV